MKRSCRAELLRRNSKDGVDESHLSRDVPLGDRIDLSFANHVDGFVSSQRTLSTPEIPEMLACLDSMSYESVILLHYIVEVLHRAMLTFLWQFT